MTDITDVLAAGLAIPMLISLVYIVFALVLKVIKW